MPAHGESDAPFASHGRVLSTSTGMISHLFDESGRSEASVLVARSWGGAVSDTCADSRTAWLAPTIGRFFASVDRSAGGVR